MNIQEKLIESAFDKFIAALDLKEIISTFNRLCDLVGINPSDNHALFYVLLRTKLKTYWKAESLFLKLDKKINQKEYRKQTACENINVLVIGSGPCGLRCAIELAMLGAKVVVLEKRDRFSRNSVLHLWPFIINDLNALGAKKFYGMFCSGSIEHISIRRLQTILLKVALIFGVQVYIGITFEKLCPPESVDPQVNVDGAGDTENSLLESNLFGWRAKVNLTNHIVNNYEFHAIIGANGKSNILGFRRKELRCRLAIAITANFINNNTPEETQVEEISGTAFIFNQQYFKDIYAKTGIDLENIVYYKDETHYFVMTAKKNSLLQKGVLKKDYDDAEALLNPQNVDSVSLQNYAKEAAMVSTNYKLKNLVFSQNHRNEPDAAIFDFTHLFAAENASKIIQRKGFPIVQILVGDSLLEPFWPTGSGCALGFLSALDAAWLIRRIGIINTAAAYKSISSVQEKILMLEAIAERESIYQRLSQTTPRNMPPHFHTYTIDPKTRYTQCRSNCIELNQIIHLYDTDDQPDCLQSLVKLQSESKYKHSPINFFLSSKIAGSNVSQSGSVKRLSLDNYFLKEKMLRWFQIKLDRFFNIKSFQIDDLQTSFYSGVALLCIIHLFKPNLIELNSITDDDKHGNFEKVSSIFEKEFDIKTNVSYPLEEDSNDLFICLKSIYDKLRFLTPIRTAGDVTDSKSSTNKSLKRKVKVGTLKSSNQENTSSPIRHIRKSVDMRFQNDVIEQGIIKQRRENIIRFYDSQMPNNVQKKIITVIPDTKLLSKVPAAVSQIPNEMFVGNGICKSRDVCHFCQKYVTKPDKEFYSNYVFHKRCFRCQLCGKELKKDSFKFFSYNHELKGKFYCLPDFEKLFKVQKENFILSNVNVPQDDLLAPKLSLKDLGIISTVCQKNVLPVENILKEIEQLSNSDLDEHLQKTYHYLRRVNDDSDFEYDGSNEESDILIESEVDANKCSNINFTKVDINFVTKNNTVIKRNRIMYKRYQCRRGSTTDSNSDAIALVNDEIITKDNKSIICDEPENVASATHKDQNVAVISSQHLINTETLDATKYVAKYIANPQDDFLSKSIISDELLNSKGCDNKNYNDNSKNLRQLAKLKFCTEPPKPVSINPKEFIGQLNQSKLKFVEIPYCLERVVFLPKIHTTFYRINQNFKGVYCSGGLIKDRFVSPVLKSSHLYSTCYIRQQMITDVDLSEEFTMDQQQQMLTEYNLNSRHNSDNLAANGVYQKFGSPHLDIFNTSDFKDIDSLSINTEESSLTHNTADFATQNDIVSKINHVPLVKSTMATTVGYQKKAVIDSELDLSLAMSFGDGYFEFNDNNNDNSSSSDLNNSLTSMTSMTSSQKSDLNEHQLNFSQKRLKRNSETILQQTLSDNPCLGKSKQTHSVKSEHCFKRSQHTSLKRLPSDPSSKNGNNYENEKFLTVQTVTPPCEIEIPDSQIKCLDVSVNSNTLILTRSDKLLPHPTDSSSSSSKCKIHDIYKQLEDIEYRLDELEMRGVTINDNSGDNNNRDDGDSNSQGHFCELYLS